SRGGGDSHDPHDDRLGGSWAGRRRRPPEALRPATSAGSKASIATSRRPFRLPAAKAADGGRQRVERLTRSSNGPLDDSGPVGFVESTARPRAGPRPAPSILASTVDD